MSVELPTAVIFDLDGTLTDRPATILAAAEALGLDGRALVRADPHGRLSMRRTLAMVDPSRRLGEKRWLKAVVEHVVAADGVEAVGRLRGRGVKVALLSNGASATQRGKLERLGLAEAFDEVVISGEVRLKKPEPAIFRLTLRRLGVEAAEAWMIGDDPERDLHPAKRLGLKAVPAAELSPLADSLADGPTVG